MKTFLLPFSLFGVLLALSAWPAQAQNDVTPQTGLAPKPLVADPKVQSVFDTLMGAVQDDSYSSFLTVVDDDFKVALTKDNFEGVVKQLGPRLKAGYEPSYLGVLDQHGYKVYLWKLVFKDKGDDMLSQLSIKEDKVGGFFLM